MIFIILALLVFVLFLWLLITRRRQYKYAPNKINQYSLDADHIEEHILKDGVLDLSQYSESQTLFVEVKCSSNFLGFLLMPYIEVENTVCINYFEYGVSGKRYINLSPLSGMKNIRLVSKYCKMNDTVKVYAYTECIAKSKRILILAPHADDAEIAAFGLYHDADECVIVTITAGEDGDSKYCELYSDQEEKSSAKGQLRTHNAMSIPELGNIPYAYRLMLGYFGSQLKNMANSPESIVSSSVLDIGLKMPFRRTKHSSLIQKHDVEPTWISLVQDLREIVKTFKPDCIVTPHPELDTHADHIYTTRALMEAVSDSFGGEYWLYTNHHPLNEYYPYGAMYSMISLPQTRAKDSIIKGKLYSYPLELKTQRLKFYALEANHDLRDSLLVYNIKHVYKQLSRQIKRTVNGRKRTYFTKSVRSNELFFICSDIKQFWNDGNSQ